MIVLNCMLLIYISMMLVTALYVAWRYPDMTAGTAGLIGIFWPPFVLYGMGVGVSRAITWMDHHQPPS